MKARRRLERVGDDAVAVGWGVSGRLVMSAALRVCEGTARGDELRSSAGAHRFTPDQWAVLVLLVFAAGVVVALRKPRRRHDRETSGR